MRSKAPDKSKNIGRIMILIKIHKTPNGDIVSMCDKNLLGKKLEDKNLKITVSEKFYKGDEIKDKTELLNLLKNTSNLNIIGAESIDFAIKNHIIEKQNVIIIKKVPHAIRI